MIRLFLLRICTALRNAITRRLPEGLVSQDQIDLEVFAATAFDDAVETGAKKKRASAKALNRDV